jgi:plasmid stabilization system protein ParE
LVFTQYADAQYSDAYLWYERAQSGLGEEFAHAVNTALARIQTDPAQFKRAPGNSRRLATKRFPYEIFYDFDAHTIVVYAVFHTSQQPDTWQSQLN